MEFSYICTDFYEFITISNNLRAISLIKKHKKE